jgi:hypothetical protein
MEYLLMSQTRISEQRTFDTRAWIVRVSLWIGALAVLATGVIHLQEYSDGYSAIPTIGTLFLLNFITATIVGLGLLLPFGLVTRLAGSIRALLAVSGIGIAAGSLVALWISEQSSLFGFGERGYPPDIVRAIVAEAVAVLALAVYLGVTWIRRESPRALASS